MTTTKNLEIGKTYQINNKKYPPMFISEKHPMKGKTIIGVRTRNTETKLEHFLKIEEDEEWTEI